MTREQIEAALKERFDVRDGRIRDAFEFSILDFVIQQVNAAFLEAANVCRNKSPHGDTCNSVCHEFSAHDILALKIK